MNKEIPLLTAFDVELRVSQIQKTKTGTYAVLLVYKNARVDMKILDEVFGALNWTREHSMIDGRLFCTVSVWDEEKGQWISKQDVGVPSNSEATKGEVSDAFKRACFNFGIGRELYSAPEIRVKLNDDEIVIGNNGKPKTYAKFFVAPDMRFDKDKNCFTSFNVLDKSGKQRFRLGESNKQLIVNIDSDNEFHSKPPFKANDTYSGFNDFGKDTVCQQCHTTIKSQKVLNYAMSKYGVPVCYDCQKRMANKEAA